jgi:hypothetical protein
MSLTLPAAAGTVLAGTNNSSGHHQPEVVLGLAARYNESILNTTVTWANSAASGTTQTASVTFGSDRVFAPSRALCVIVRNPSSQTALNGVAQVQYTDNVTTRYAALAPFTVDATAVNGDGQAYLVDGGIMGQGIRISLSNATALNSSGTFSARVVVYHL